MRVLNWTKEGAMDIDMAVLLAVALIAFLQLEIRYPIETRTWMPHTTSAEMQRPTVELDAATKLPPPFTNVPNISACD